VKLPRLLEVSGHCNLGCKRNFSNSAAMNLATSGTDKIPRYIFSTMCTLNELLHKVAEDFQNNPTLQSF
jgi:hypothetical protein